ncbi:interferon-inducible double-stranded RNA-dependent protein kinase activator A-like [Planococcus citri]|uniref:interferon-inducible double-stranded RNA-dependent protein kinase activator A-like n=1 Tax=Planococcus citri TaxID=170843 RepID=UPI0031F9D7C7
MPEVEKPAHSKLNEYAQKYGTNKKAPDYTFTDRMDRNNRKEFICKCRFEGRTTEGVGSSKNEAKRNSANHMLVLLHEIDPSKFAEKVRLEEEEISNTLEHFDRLKLDMYLEKLLEDRETDYSSFRRSFVGDLPENSEDYQIKADVNSPQSKTLDKLKISGIGVVNLGNSCTLFKAIVNEMKLRYFAEFLETAKNDRYAVVIKMNINLFTAGGVGESPEQAIQNACKNAIEFLLVLNM